MKENKNPHDGSTLDDFFLEEERDAWRACAESLVDYAREFIVNLETWGKGYDRYDRELQEARESVARYNELVERTKKCNNTQSVNL